MTNAISVSTVVLAEVIESAISVTDLGRIVSHRRAGAVLSFVGAVSDHDHGRSVIHLAYEAHPNAGAVQKAQVPIWKHQFYADGTDEWVNRP